MTADLYSNVWLERMCVYHNGHLVKVSTFTETHSDCSICDSHGLMFKAQKFSKIHVLLIRLEINIMLCCCPKIEIVRTGHVVILREQK